jgi:hypothetical protein
MKRSTLLIGLVFAAAAVGAVVLGGRFVGDHPAVNGTSSALPCEALAFPCSWAEVPAEALRQSFALGAQAAARVQAESPHSVAGWLRTQPGVVEVLESDGTVVFRLSGARRIWLNWELLGSPTVPRPAAAVAPPGPVLTLQSPAGPSLLGAARRLLPWPVTLHAQETGGAERHGGVVGIDYDNDGSITQRDPKRALILVPDPHLYGDQAREVQNLLEGTPGYDFEDSVKVLSGPEAGPAAFQTWNDYDLIHVATRGATSCWSVEEQWISPDSGGVVNDTNCAWFLLTGMVVAPEDVDGRIPQGPGVTPNAGGADTPVYQDELNNQGLEISAVRNAQNELEWRVMATSRFFRDAYPSGVRRAVVFLNASNPWALTKLGDTLAGSPARSTVVMWRTARTADEAAAVGSRFYAGGAEGWAPSDIFRIFLAQVPCDSGPNAPICGLSAKLAVDLRIREVVSLRAQTPSGQSGEVLQDATPLEALMDSPLAPDPGIFVTVDVEGIVPDDIDIPVRLELDGRPIAERSLAEATTPADVEYNVSRLHFDDVAVGPDVQDGKEHELQAIVSLPRGGESRFAVTLTTIDRRCYWEADVQGPGLSGTFVGAGIRMMDTGRFSVLQLDSGRLSTSATGPHALTGVTFPLGMPPTEGAFSATGSMVGMYSGSGAIVGTTQSGSVNLMTLQDNPDDQSRSVAGTFEAVFAGVIVGNRPVMGSTVLEGRFIGRLSGTKGCGSESFRWFDAIPRAAGGGS